MHESNDIWYFRCFFLEFNFIVYNDAWLSASIRRAVSYAIIARCSVERSHNTYPFHTHMLSTSRRLRCAYNIDIEYIVCEYSLQYINVHTTVYITLYAVRAKIRRCCGFYFIVPIKIINQ